MFVKFLTKEPCWHTSAGVAMVLIYSVIGPENPRKLYTNQI